MNLTTLFIAALVILALLLILCLYRAVRGPHTTDRIIASNMMGTITVACICILAALMKETYLEDIAIIYAMLSFLAVVVLSKIYIGVYRAQHRKEKQK